MCISFRSRTSLQAYIPPRGFHTGLQQIAERAQIQVQIALFEPEMLDQLLHAAIELHERVAEALDLLVGERAALHPAERLPLHQLAQQLDEREHELREALLDLLGVGVHSARERLGQMLELAGDSPEVAVGLEQLVDRAHRAPSAKEYGGQGPVHTTVTPGAASTCAAARRNSATSSAATRYAALSSPPRRCSVVARARRARGSWRSATRLSWRCISPSLACMYSAPEAASTSCRPPSGIP